MTIRLYNTLTRNKEDLTPVTPGKVGIYLCGPTVYAKAHIGHMVGPVIFDTVKRYLVYSGYEVTWVVNITDVDDKLIKKGKERGLSMAQVARENTADYLANLAGLGVDQIDHMPKATENIDEIIRFIQGLIDQDFAYAADGDVFFDVGKDPGYGKLSNRSADSQQGEGGEAAAKKRSSSDFALWKAAKPDEPYWDSPWGHGRPGWHIECSAMSRRLLGETFDIHGGGLDLIFPHHENEIAQSECCHGKPMVKYWMHNGLLRASAAGKVGGRTEREAADATVDTKMSRSKGAGGLADQIARFGGETIRFFLLRTHYRSTVEYSEQGLEETKTGLDGFARFFERYQRITGQSFYELVPITRRADGELAAGDDPAVDGSGPAACRIRGQDGRRLQHRRSDQRVVRTAPGAEQVRRPAAVGGPGGSHPIRVSEFPSRRRNTPRTDRRAGLVPLGSADQVRRRSGSAEQTDGSAGGIASRREETQGLCDRGPDPAGARRDGHHARRSQGRDGVAVAVGRKKDGLR